MVRDSHGERIAALEERYDHVVLRLDHLDKCVDSVRAQAEISAESARQNERLWDRRWWIGVGILATMMFISGWGLLSVKELFVLLAKFGH